MPVLARVIAVMTSSDVLASGCAEEASGGSMRAIAAKGMAIMHSTYPAMSASPVDTRISVPSRDVTRREGCEQHDDAWLGEMAWAEPQFTREQVNAAGNSLVRMFSADVRPLSDFEWQEFDQAMDIIENWRASHGYPLNTFQINLRRAARRLDPAALIAQRTKRLSSIFLKLRRFRNMKLSQMQDIGGCRAVVRSVAATRQLDQYYVKQSSMKHGLATRDDYISMPKDSGYRGIHLVYRYHSDKQAKAMYSGLKIEMQLRSQYQHAWATAVETVGTFVQEALKSSTGPDEWLRFFALMGTAIALREQTTPVPNTPTNRRELVSELDHFAYLLDVENRLRVYSDALQAVEQRAEQAHYYLLVLDPSTRTLVITGFRHHEIDTAQKKYSEAERTVKERPGTDAVLVAVESLAALRKAYPNYFADTRVFVQLLQQALSGHQRRIFTGALRLERT